jgi:hypothetical protein
MRAMRERLEALGPVGLVIHFSIHGLCIFLFWLGINEGVVQRIDWLAQRMPASGASLVVAYGLSRALLPVRLAITVALTPIVQRWWAGRRGAA